MLSWESIRDQKQAQRASKILPEWRIPQEKLASFGDLGAIEFVEKSGILTDRELEITSWTAVEVLKRVHAGEITAYEVTKAICHRAAIAQQISNCLTEIFFDEALERAKELDSQFSSNGGKPVGPLHGLPISIKDLFNVPGYDSTIGLIAWANQPAKEWAVPCKILLDAGAILYCKTNIPQIMMTFEGWNPVWDRSKNPYNLTLTSGGSSGGESALVALRGSFLGVGTDLGGSVRIPAGFCGLWSLRPSVGRISRKGGRALTLGCPGGIYGVQGPMANSLEDLEMYTRVMVNSNQSLDDPDVIPIPYRSIQLPKKLKFGYYTSNGLARPVPPIERSVLETVSAVKAAGHEVVEFNCFEISKLLGLVYALWTADGQIALRDIMKISGEPADEYISNPFLRFGSDEPVFQEPYPDEAVAEVAKWEKGHLTVSQLWELTLERDNFKSRYLEYLNSLGIDAIICPIMAVPAVPHDTGRDLMATLTYTMLYSLLDYSATTIPVSKVKPSDAPLPSDYAFANQFERKIHEIYTPERFANAPLSVQIVCRRLEEEKVIEITKVVRSCLEAGKA